MKSLSGTVSSTIAAIAFSTIPSLAQDAPTLADLGKDTALTAAFEAMTQGTTLPDWTRSGMVTSPAQNVRFDGRDWIVLSGCKPHDCASQQIAVIWSQDEKTMYGLLSETPADGRSQRLDWLNIGGGPESIDGRTILFAALTGSLANHPRAFDYD